MANEQTPPRWFAGQEPNEDDPSYERRKKQLLEELPKLLARERDRGRAQSFYPYLLVRSVLGDRGDRPINVPFWESPDIWTAPGVPDSSPAVPPDHGGTITAGVPNTVYAHVWNLGFAPLAGVVVEFYWFNPSLSIDGTHANLIGTARCELASRGMSGSHALVKCPKPWIPVIENGGHECLVVRAYGIGDPLGANEWQPWLNRHIAQRNVSVVAAATSSQLVLSLGALEGVHRLQLVQLSAREGEIAARIAAPKAKVSPKVRTRVLAEVDARLEVTLETRREAHAAVLAPVHLLAAGDVPVAPALDARAAVVDTRAIVEELPDHALATHVGALMGAVAGHEGHERLPPPARGEAHVLRVANYDETGQLVGGYTMVVAQR
jgi:hypothetical protein